jgi:aminomethyltransferase
MSLLATPFHARAVEANRCNAWENRQGYTLASHYGSVAEEAVAARFGAVLVDLSWRWQAMFSGAAVEAFVARAFSRNGAALAIGMSLEVLWLNDAGAVRGQGTLWRLAPERFVLLSPQDDRDWLFYAASLFGVSCCDQSSNGMLALTGPTARKILSAAGLAADPAQGGQVPLNWRGLDIRLCRLGLGYELWCDADSALIVWDRLMAAGRSFALLPAGQAALDVLEGESGLLRPGRDFTPSRDGFGSIPHPQDLGLCHLVDRAHIFNGKAGFLAAGRDTVLLGLLLSAAPSTAVLTHLGVPIGKILSTRYSPALQQTLGFVILTGSWPSGEVTVGSLPCRVVGLPFLPMGLSPDNPSGVAPDSATERADRPV